MKTCSDCKKDKPLCEFNKKGKGTSSKCKECNKKYLKNHYDNDPEYYKKKNTRRRKETRDYINSKKVKLSCSKCGESHISCLDFHHIEDKEVNIAEMQTRMWKKERIDEEINKCIILCSNCHRKLHWEERNSSVV